MIEKISGYSGEFRDERLLQESIQSLSNGADPERLLEVYLKLGFITEEEFQKGYSELSPYFYKP